MEEEMTEYVIKTKSDDGKFEHEFHVKMDVNYKGTIRHIKQKLTVPVKNRSDTYEQARPVHSTLRKSSLNARNYL